MEAATPKENKRKRTEHATKACENCKSRHKKCDGQSPCQRCTKSGNECVFTTSTLKRGPGGKIKQLQEKIDLLQEELKKANDFNKELQDHIFVQPEVEPTQSTDIILNPAIYPQPVQMQSTPASTAIITTTTTTTETNDEKQSKNASFTSPLFRSLEVSTCITHYLDHFKDFRGVSLPKVDLYNFFNDEGNLRHNLLLSCALANMASYVGHPTNAQSFLQKAKTLMPLFFDCTHPDVAYSHSFMADSYGRLCKRQESELHNGIAITMVRSLMRKSDIASDNQQLSSLSNTLADLLFNSVSTSLSRSAYKRNLEQYEIFCKSSTLIHGTSWRTFVLAHLKIWFLVQCGATDKMELMSLIDEAAMLIPKEADQTSMFHIILNVCKASFYFHFGNSTLSTKLCDLALENLENRDIKANVGSVFLLCAIGQIYRGLGCFTQYQKTLEQINELAPHFPIAETCNRILISPHTVDSKEITMLVPIFGRRFEPDDDDAMLIAPPTTSSSSTTVSPQEITSPASDCGSSSSSSPDLFSSLSSPQLMSFIDTSFLDDMQ